MKCTTFIENRYVRLKRFLKVIKCNCDDCDFTHYPDSWTGGLHYCTVCFEVIPILNVSLIIDILFALYNNEQPDIEILIMLELIGLKV